MSYICKYCGTSLSSKRCLNLHENTASYCLEIQRKKGLEVAVSEFKCKCGSKFTQKSSLKRHQEKCENNVSQVNNECQVYNAGRDVNIQQNYNINVTYTMGNLTPEFIMKTLKPVLTLKVLQGGMSALTDIIIDVLLQRDGKYIYYCTDRSRKEFKMLINHMGEVVEKADPEAFAMRRVLHAPLCNLVSDMKLDDSDKLIKTTFEEVKNLQTDGKKFTSDISVKLPKEPDAVPDELAELFRLTDEFALQESKRQAEIEKCRLIESATEQKRKTQQSIDDLLDNCVKRSEGNYWHKARHWVVDIDSRQNPVIIGYAPKQSDKMLNLSKAQVQTIMDLGLHEYLDKQYKL